MSPVEGLGHPPIQQCSRLMTTMSMHRALSLDNVVVPFNGLTVRNGAARQSSCLRFRARRRAISLTPHRDRTHHSRIDES